MQMTADQLRPNFEPFGNVEEVTIIYDSSTHLSKGAPPSSAERAARSAPSGLPAAEHWAHAGDPGPRRSARLKPPLPILLFAGPARRLWLRDILHRGCGAGCDRGPERQMRAGEPLAWRSRPRECTGPRPSPRHPPFP